LEEPELIQREIDRRIQAIRESDPSQRRESALRKEQVRLHNRIERLVDAYQEELLSLEALRQRMPPLRQRLQTVQCELQSLEATAVDQKIYLRLAENMDSFLSRLRASANTLNVTEQQKILRLVVKEILVDRDDIIIRHSIPVKSSDLLPAGASEGTKLPGYLLRSGSRFTDTRQYLSSLCLRGVV
jgi:site-specific DNA recombinase